MVETSLRPRPTFSSFLHSDADTGGDALSYYQYQRLLRSQKVALLQEKRRKSYVPGYKKPLQQPLIPVVPFASRQIFQKKSQDAVASEEKESHCKRGTDGKLTSPSRVIPSQVSPTPVTTEGEKTVPRPSGDTQLQVHAQTERLPQISTQRERRVKSATVHDRRQSCPATMKAAKLQRTKTVSGTRDAQLQTALVAVDTPSSPSHAHPPVVLPQEGSSGGVHRRTVSEQAPVLEERSLPSDSLPHAHHRAHTEGTWVMDLEDPGQGEEEREKLAKAFFWSTATQRGYDEVGWSECLPPPVPPPHTTLERFPDPVSQKLTFRRYNSAPAGWQVFGSEWDYAQTRVGGYMKGPQSINFCSPSRKTHHIPGYWGCVPGGEELDNPDLQLGFPMLVRSFKPRPTNIARRPNIPGYTGHVHWTRVNPAHSDVPIHHLTMSSRVHRPMPCEEEPSPYRRTGVFSKTVSLISPYNPFNKIEQ